MSTVAISVPSFTILTLFALSPLIVVSSLFVVGINSFREGGYPYSSFLSIMNYNIASCTLQGENPDRYARFQVIILKKIIFTISFLGSYILKRNSGGIWFDEGGAQTLSSGIQISAITFPGNNAQFDSRFMSTGGGIMLQNSKGDQKRITLSSTTGRVHVN
jgi:hypothetical protein